MSKWISVTERLPEEGQVVCVSDGKSTWDYGTLLIKLGTWLV